jgi:hypothetical protein
MEYRCGALAASARGPALAGLAGDTGEPDSSPVIGQNSGMLIADEVTRRPPLARRRHHVGRGRGWRLGGMSTVLLLAATPGHALNGVELRFEHLQGPAWSAHNVTLTGELRPDGALAATLRADRVRLAAPVGTLRDVHLHCPALQISGPEYRCRNARLRTTTSPLGALDLYASVTLDTRSSEVHLLAERMVWERLALQLEAYWRPGAWQVAVAGDALALADVQPVVARVLPAIAPLAIHSGVADVAFDIHYAAGQPLSAAGEFAWRQLVLDNAAGTVAADDMSGGGRFQLRGTQPDATLDLHLEAARGEVYVEPVYINLAGHPVQLDARAQLSRGAPARISRLTYEHDGNLRAEITGDVRLGTRGVDAEFAEIVLNDVRFPAAYGTYLEGFLVGTPLARLDTQGALSARAHIEHNRLAAAALSLEDLNGDDSEGKLALYGLTGDVHWRRHATPASTTASPAPVRPSAHAPGTAAAATTRHMLGTGTSRLRWSGGFVKGIGFGRASTAFTVHGDDFRLLDQLEIPVLDGALRVSTLTAAGLVTDNPLVEFDAFLSPVDLRRLTAALGWPAFPGTLSGELPLLSLRDGTITLGGNLVARVFDGEVRVSDLRVEEPFSSARRTRADITLRNLDLALLTDVVTLGRIEGRLDGHVDDLTLIRARPVAFDASFHTASGARGRRRISRRALDNISEIAGGGTALLSNGLLSLFRDFAYRELGIRCRLHNDVCHMGGVAAAGDGYFLVRGRGLPHIDVVAYSREVDWRRLVAQITEALARSRADKPATATEEP